MKPQEDKENAIWVEERVPTTPTHLLSRSQSLVKNKSPKRVRPRRPLASKDNNKTNNFAFKKSNEPLPLKKKSRPLVSHTGSFINSTRPGQGSIVSSNGAPRIKSIVLKDTAEEEESQSDDEDINPLAAKLKKALMGQHKSDNEDEEQVGLLGTQRGLQGLISSRQTNDSSDSDMEIETIPPHAAPLPHIPNGYTPFDDEDVVKLQTYTSPFTLDAEEDVQERSNSNSELFSISINRDDDIDHPRKVLPTSEIAPSFGIEPKQDSFELDPPYDGSGLTTEELESLLN